MVVRCRDETIPLLTPIVAQFPKSLAAAEFHRRVIQGHSSFSYMIQYGPLYSYRAQCCTSVQVIIRDNNMYNNYKTQLHRHP